MTNLNDIPEDLTEKEKLLPAWFASRMTSDYWTFGLLTTTGQIICIKQITNISQAADGTIWLDVEMATELPNIINRKSTNPNPNYFLSPTESRTQASINASHIIAAFELEYS